MKYFVVIVIAIAFVFATYWFTKSLNPNKSDLAEDKVYIESITNRPTELKDKSQSLVEPKMVKVTYGDSLYHDLTCEWIGRNSQKMSLENAIEKDFYPCSQCMGED